MLLLIFFSSSEKFALPHATRTTNISCTEKAFIYPRHFTNTHTTHIHENSRSGYWIGWCEYMCAGEKVSLQLMRKMNKICFMYNHHHHTHAVKCMLRVRTRTRTSGKMLIFGREKTRKNTLFLAESFRILLLLNISNINIWHWQPCRHCRCRNTKLPVFHPQRLNAHTHAQQCQWMVFQQHNSFVFPQLHERARLPVYVWMCHYHQV